MPRGIPNSTPGLGPSENTKKLLEAMQELQDRIDAEKAKDKARALLVVFCQRHGLTAQDLRAAAKVVGDRNVGDAPVTSKLATRPLRPTKLKPAQGKVGKAIRSARVKANMSDKQVGLQIGAGGSQVQKWQTLGVKVPERFHEGLTRVLKLPAGLLNGAAHGEA